MIETDAEKYGINRLVNLKLPNSTITRPVNKVSLMEESTLYRLKMIRTGGGVCFMNYTRQMTSCSVLLVICIL